MFKLSLFLFLSVGLCAQTLTSQIANMIIIGFEGEKVPKHLADFIQKNGIGGVILFKKNIKNPLQLRELTKRLKSLDTTIMIATDQEGGLVERLSDKNGFYHTPKPIEVADMDSETAQKIYTKMAKMLHQNGINVNFAPSVDLAKNPKNRVIAKYGRAFSADAKKVIVYGDIFMKAMEKEGVLSVLKHFPGHGSSLADSHKGFVDVSESWGKEELEPFLKLPAKMVMSAHIFNSHLDKHYPATLSKKTNAILRKSGFNGVLVSDDLQMRAISQNYDLNTTLTKAINASVDMLLFGNQLSKPIMIESLVDAIQALVEVGEIDINRIVKANRRINAIKKELYARR
jgi:beta-N-acetylhexosaminidase